MRYLVCLMFLQYVVPPWVFWCAVGYVVLRVGFRFAKIAGKSIKEMTS